MGSTQSTWDSRSNQIRMSRVSLLVVFFLAAAASAKQVERHPKLFFVSTSSTTSTLSTGTVCYITTGTVSTCTGRKRRAISFDGASSDVSELRPSQLKEDVQSSKKDGRLDREGRFLLYWITATSISTSTSFTTTFSVFSVSCTPSGASACG